MRSPLVLAVLALVAQRRGAGGTAAATLVRWGVVALAGRALVPLVVVPLALVASLVGVLAVVLVLAGVITVLAGVAGLG